MVCFKAAVMCQLMQTHFKICNINVQKLCVNVTTDEPFNFPADVPDYGSIDIQPTIVSPRATDGRVYH